jgi:ribulose-5-phosphate 4-epimerase/fuculose-1-phosphate aldolase
LLRWEPETIVNLPEGIGVLPGSAALMALNIAGLRAHRIVLWSKHGVMARSDQSVTKAADRIEYAETAARYEYMDLANGQKAEGLTRPELQEVVRAFDVPTTLQSIWQWPSFPRRWESSLAPHPDEAQANHLAMAVIPTKVGIQSGPTP